MLKIQQGGGEAIGTDKLLHVAYAAPLLLARSPSHYYYSCERIVWENVLCIESVSRVSVVACGQSVSSGYFEN